MYIKKYIENLDCEIGKLIKKECEYLHYADEKALHILFENRKHAKEFLAENAAMPDAKNPY